MKKLPPLLLGLALVFWGWQTDFWVIAVPVALILESQRLVQWRCELSAADLRRASNYGLIAGGLALLYLLFAQRSFSLFYTLLQWLPIIFSPLIVAQTYSTREIIYLQDLLPVWKKLPKLSKPGRAINLQIFYFLLCLLSASATNTQGYGFYAGMIGLSAGILWAKRSKRFSPVVWFGLMVLVANVGFAGHLGLHQLQAKVDQQANQWLQQLSGQEADPFQAYTQLGSIGRLKLSDAILFRVAATDRRLFPILLRDASYNRYHFSTWVAAQPKFSPVPRQPDGVTWRFDESTYPPAALTITTHLKGGTGLLSLPSGSLQLNQLPVERVERNQYGAVKVAGKTEAVSYQVLFNPQQTWDSPPTEADLQIPATEKPAIDRVWQQLQMQGKPPEEVMARLQNYFQNDFQYSLKLADTSSAATPLSAFLLQNHAGHCEYFASATVLLLRQAGIPARYATGYSVHEFSQLEGQYVVRGRNAHAWAMAYLNGTWYSFDTTPGSWIPQENNAASPWQRVLDLWSFLVFKLSSNFGNILSGHPVWWILGLVFVPLLWQLKRLRLKRPAVQAKPAKRLEQPTQVGRDSEFYRIEQALAEWGCSRHPDEALSLWLQRLQTTLPESQFVNLRVILELHYRYRFDPQGISASDRERLKALCQSWLESHQRREHQSQQAKVRK